MIFHAFCDVLDYVVKDCQVSMKEFPCKKLTPGNTASEYEILNAPHLEKHISEYTSMNSSDLDALLDALDNEEEPRLKFRRIARDSPEPVIPVETEAESSYFIHKSMIWIVILNIICFSDFRC